ncbi:MAG: ABC transporter ATP-binding protein [Microbacterium sp.]
MTREERATSPLRLVGIHKSFGGMFAIKRFDLEVGRGEIVALVGDNGAGKSPLVKIISGLYQPSEGEIWINGRQVQFRDASDARATLSDLSGGQRQGVAICRATHWASGLVLMDEPTAALGVAETAKVEALFLTLKERGSTVLLVSHTMDQVFRVSDRVAVLRRGTQVATRTLSETSHNEIVAMSTGVAA